MLGARARHSSVGCDLLTRGLTAGPNTSPLCRSCSSVQHTNLNRALCPGVREAKHEIYIYIASSVIGSVFKTSYSHFEPTHTSSLERCGSLGRRYFSRIYLEMRSFEEMYVSTCVSLCVTEYSRNSGLSQQEASLSGEIIWWWGVWDPDTGAVSSDIQGLVLLLYPSKHPSQLSGDPECEAGYKKKIRKTTLHSQNQLREVLLECTLITSRR